MTSPGARMASTAEETGARGQKDGLREVHCDEGRDREGGKRTGGVRRMETKDVRQELTWLCLVVFWIL